MNRGHSSLNPNLHPMSKRSLRSLPALLVALPLVACILYPLAALLLEGLNAPVADFRAQLHGWDPKAQPAAAALRALWREPPVRQAAWGTFKLAVLTVLAGGAWGLGLALLWWRREFPARRIFALLGYAPVLLPPLVGTLAFARLLGESGMLNRMLPSAGGKPFVSPIAGVLILHTYSFGIYTYAFAAAALEHLDHAHEEAVRNLGGGTWAVFWHAVRPALQGPLAAAALLTFMAAGASFSGPYLLDTRGQYLTVEIVNELSSSDPAYVAALTLLLAVLSLAALPPFLWVQRQGAGLSFGTQGLKGGGGRALPRAGAGEAAVRIALSLCAALLLLLPPLMIAQGAFADPQGWYTGAWPQTLNLDAFHRLDSDAWAALRRSLRYGVLAAGIDVCAALLVALALRRAPAWAGLPAESSVMLAVALPGSAVANALLTAFNAPSWLTAGQPLGQTATILVLAYAVRCLPLAVRPVRAALEGLGGDLEAAARGLGAGPLRTLACVILPLLIPTLLAAGLLCFVTSAGEFVASKLLFSIPSMPVSVKMDEVLRNDPPAATALGLCLMGLGAAAVGLAGWLQARASWRARRS